MYFACQITDCGNNFPSAKALVNHMNLHHCDDKRLNAVCAIDGCCYHFNTVETFQKHLRAKHMAHWAGEYCDIVNNGANCPDDNESTVSLDDLDDDLEDDQFVWNRFCNDFAKNLAFLKLKITESYMLPKSISNKIFCDFQSLFDSFQEAFVNAVKGRLDLLKVNYRSDTVLQQVFADVSFLSFLKANLQLTAC
jgi:hypothetical protein